MTDAIEKESLKDEMRNVVEEARMVIPGVQALFGFQTVATFNNRFQDLPMSGVVAHLIALAMLVLSVALLMTPAAYHRLAERGQVSRKMIIFSSRLITGGMIPLMLSLSLDVYVVLLAAIEDAQLGIYGGILTFCIFTILWFVFPIKMRNSR